MFAKTYATEQDAIKHLKEIGYAWHDGLMCWYRNNAGINQRAYVGMCRTGEWLISAA